MASHTASQKYLSTRGGSYGLSFEEVVLKGLANDGGLFIPESIPELPEDWLTKWRDHSFEDLAYEIFSLYISPAEIPSADLKELVKRSYSTFRASEKTPVVTLDEQHHLYLLELFHGPTFAFKDVALQFLGNLFEYFLVRRNEGKTGKDREHLTVIGATSGDTGSAAIYGLRGKKDVSVFIMHPQGKVSPIQEAQMTTVLDPNVHNLAVTGTFDDCQDIVKALFADPSINKTHRLAAVNSINWARILAQITYYFSSYFSLLRSHKHSATPPNIHFVVPTGNFGDILAGYFAKRMGLPVAKLVIATNENDILHRWWQTGHYEKHPVHGKQAQGGIKADGVKAHESGVKETLSPAMDILVSSNFERLLYFLALQVYGCNRTIETKRLVAGAKVKEWHDELKKEGGFKVCQNLLDHAKHDFDAYRVSDDDTIKTIQQVYDWGSKPISQPPTNGAVDKTATTGTRGANGAYILDPHSAIGVAAALRSIHENPAPTRQHVALATAHPAKFSHAVDTALRGKEGFDFETVLPVQFEGMLEKEKRVITVKPGEGWEAVREIVIQEVEKERQHL
ncbi:threonine synthase-like protein [Aulographum hederae CBS 113979]|uniref:threonine synthase n=1 Tax=Aulographum hederae CBS 113979 TaxID=1176131 RepID=A0A6G1H8D1_9PEZI|nr:threonine synthase-like protein [Aulographum hederae CBS 113979]